MSNDAKRISDAIFEQFANMLARFVAETEPTEENVAAMVSSLMAVAAAGAIRFDVDQGAYMRIARQAYAYAMAETRAVDAEDDN